VPLLERARCAAQMEVTQSLAASLPSVAVAVPRYMTERVRRPALVVPVVVHLVVVEVTAGYSARARQAKAIPVLLPAALGIPVVAAALVALALIAQREVASVSNTPSQVHLSTSLAAAAVLGIPVTVVTVAPAVAVAGQ